MFIDLKGTLYNFYTVREIQFGQNYRYEDEESDVKTLIGYRIWLRFVDGQTREIYYKLDEQVQFARDVNKFDKIMVG